MFFITASCSDTINLQPGEEITLDTPGFERFSYYQEGTQCNWLIRVSIVDLYES